MSVRFFILVCLLAGLPALCRASTTEYKFETADCPFEKKSWFDPQRMRCGTAVAVEPGVSQPIRVPAIRITRKDASSRAAPVVFMNGGPGGRGVAEVGDWLGHPLLQRHDLILYDSRGTGQASPLPCPELGAGVLALIAKDLDASAELQARTKLVGPCLAAMPAALLGVFTTPHMARDIDAIRRMFGYERVSLYAVSYGTRIAMAYANAYPQHLDKLLLDSVVPPQAYYQDVGDTFGRALERTFVECERSAACNSRFPQFRKNYGDILAELRARPLRLHMPGGGYANDTVSLNAQDFSLLMQQLFYGDELIPTFPLMIDELKRGNSAPLALLFDVTVGMRVKGLNFATYYLVLGNDELPLRSTALRNASAAKSDLMFFAQDMKLLESLRIFSGTNATPAAAKAFSGPVLVIAGSFDPITAPSYGAALASGGGSNARYLEFPASGHTASLSDDCARAAAVGFLAAGKDGASVPCIDTLQPTAWAGDVYRSSWPRNWIESIFFPRTTVPLFWFGALMVLYVGLGLGAVAAAAYQTFRRSGSPKPQRSRTERNTRMLARTGFVAGAILVAGLCALLFQTVTASAPAVLLFGLPVAAYGLAGLALVLALLTVLMAMALVRAWRGPHRQLRPHLWLTAATLTNLGLIAFLLRWQVLVPA